MRQPEDGRRRPGTRRWPADRPVRAGGDHRPRGAAAAAAHQLRAGQEDGQAHCRRPGDGPGPRRIVRRWRAQGASPRSRSNRHTDDSAAGHPARAVDDLDVRRLRRSRPTTDAGVGRDAGWDSTTIVVVEVARRRHDRPRLHLRRRGAGDRRRVEAAPRSVDRRRAARCRRAPGRRCRSATPAGQPGIGAMAVSAVDIALWDLKAKLLGRAAGRRAAGASARGAGLRQRRLHQLPAVRAAEQVARLGGHGHSPG